LGVKEIKKIVFSRRMGFKNQGEVIAIIHGGVVRSLFTCPICQGHAWLKKCVFYQKQLHRRWTLNSMTTFIFIILFMKTWLIPIKIDESVSYSWGKYNLYNRFLYKKLDEMPSGTRLATFRCLEDKIPAGYHMVESKVGCLLKFWLKI
jgi:hypothetical protein